MILSQNFSFNNKNRYKLIWEAFMKGNRDLIITCMLLKLSGRHHAVIFDMSTKRNKEINSPKTFYKQTLSKLFIAKIWSMPLYCYYNVTNLHHT